MLALLLSLAALAADPEPTDGGPQRTPSRGVPGMPSPSEILWGGELEALFHVRDGGVPVGVGHWSWPTLAAPPASIEACVLDLTVAPDGETTAEKRWCDGTLSEALDPGPWKLVPAEGQTEPLSRRITVYALPDGRVIGALYGTKASEREKLPDGFVYGRDPDVLRRHDLPDPTDGARAEPVECRFRLLVDEKGRPTEVAVDECPDDLGALAVPVLRKWRYEPAEVLGHAVAAEVLVRHRYEPVESFALSPKETRAQERERKAAERAAKDEPAGPPPAFWLDYGSHPRVAVLAWTLPAAPSVTATAHCEVSFEFRRQGRLTFIDGCEGEWRDAVEAAVATWRFGPVALYPAESARRYRVGVYALPDGTVRAALWGVEPETRAELPEGFAYGVASEVKWASRIDVPKDRDDGWCSLLARLDAAGDVLDVQNMGCAEPYATAIGTAAANEWRFTAAQLDGEPVPSLVEIYVRLAR